ncbi:MAG: hypothetical protein AAB593_01235 [Patescibacteria group bacterium]
MLKEESIQKLLSSIYDDNEGIRNIALSKLLDIGRDKGDKKKLIEIIVHGILNSIQTRLEDNHMRAGFLVLEELPMDNNLKLKVIDIVSKKIPILKTKSLRDIATGFVEKLKNKN